MWLKNQLAKHSVEWDDVMRTHNEDIMVLREQLSARAKQFAIQSQSTQEINQLAQQNQRLSQELDKVIRVSSGAWEGGTNLFYRSLCKLGVFFAFYC